MLIHLKDEKFEQEIKEGIVVVDFFATWCGPCKMLGPVIEAMASKMSDVKFIKVDVDQFEDLAREYGVMSVPTIFIMKDGEPIDQSVGFIPEEILTRKIETVKNQ